MIPRFSLDLPHGRCVGIDIPAGLTPELNAALLPDEQVYLTSLAPTRQPSFAAGRVALRAALGAIAGDPEQSRDFTRHALLSDAGGAPLLPDGALGSISHKRTLAIALAALAPARDAPRAALGVDLEEYRLLRVDITRRVLTERERAHLAASIGEADAAELTLERDRRLIQYFSLKEAFYKAVNGFGLAHVSFQNVEVSSISADGAVAFAPPPLLQQRLEISGWITSPLAGYVVASTRAQLRTVSRDPR